MDKSIRDNKEKQPKLFMQENNKNPSKQKSLLHKKDDNIIIF